MDKKISVYGPVRRSVTHRASHYGFVTSRERGRFLRSGAAASRLPQVGQDGFVPFSELSPCPSRADSRAASAAAGPDAA